jgi:adenine-specific DNA-methyltransferase
MKNSEIEVNEIPGHTPELKTELAIQISELAPEIFLDGKIDFERLKELLGVDLSEDSERFGLFWPGKKRALRAAQQATSATLQPDKQNSRNWDSTKNILIEGDNLEVLKILQKHYHGKVKMIYIDPPYNTGNDFIYPDNYKEGLASYLEWSNQVSQSGAKLSTNTESDGRYHSSWLSMMYPRLKLARNLLTEDGAIFISIDSNESDNLRKICNEIFGEANYLNEFVWVANLTGRQISGRGAAQTSERVLVYARNAKNISEFYVNVDFAKSAMPDAYKGFKKEMREDEQGAYAVGDTLWNHNRMFNEETRPNLVFSIFYNPETEDIRSGDLGTSIPGYVEILPHANGDGVHKYHAWRWSRPKVDREKNDLVVKKLQKGYEVYTKIRGFSQTVLKDLITNISNGTKETQELFEGKKYFDYPKSTDLVKLFIAAMNTENSIILDFFAGSGTTSHAVMSLNSEDGGDRQFIQVQLPEPTPEDSEARKSGFKSISELSRRRVALAGEDIDSKLAPYPVDTGFRSFFLSDTNFTKWQVQNDVELDKLEQHILDLRESASDGATAEILLCEILLKQGYSLTEQISSVEISGLKVSSVGNNLILAYLEELKPKLDQLKAVLELSPAKFILLEDAFQGDDELKTNLAQECKSRNIELWTA